MVDITFNYVCVCVLLCIFSLYIILEDHLYTTTDKEKDKREEVKERKGSEETGEDMSGPVLIVTTVKRNKSQTTPIKTVSVKKVVRPHKGMSSKGATPTQAPPSIALVSKLLDCTILSGGYIALMNV